MIFIFFSARNNQRACVIYACLYLALAIYQALWSTYYLVNIRQHWVSYLLLGSSVVSIFFHLALLRGARIKNKAHLMLWLVFCVCLVVPTYLAVTINCILEKQVFCIVENVIMFLFITLTWLRVFSFYRELHQIDNPPDFNNPISAAQT